MIHSKNIIKESKVKKIQQLFVFLVNNAIKNESVITLKVNALIIPYYSTNFDICNKFIIMLGSIDEFIDTQYDFINNKLF